MVELFIGNIDYIFIAISIIALMTILVASKLGNELLSYKGTIDRIWYFSNLVIAYVLLFFSVAGPGPIIVLGLKHNDLATIVFGSTLALLGVLLLMVSSMKRMNVVSGFHWWLFPILYFLSIVPSPIAEYSSMLLPTVSMMLLLNGSDTKDEKDSKDA